MMNDRICELESCTGCSACASGCPKQCISMKADDEGFLRPSVDSSLCIDCGKCKRICPANNFIPDDGRKPQAFATKNKNEEVRAQSSSGGMFSVFAKNILGFNGVVIAAGFDESYQVVHKVCGDIEGLDELRKSKYVQSRIEGTYQEAKNLLEEGKKVLFCGTPCQVAGIKSFLGKEYEKLYLIDFVCHGVPSPLAWERYKQYREEQAGSSVQDVAFRSKDTGWQVYSLKIKFDNGVTYSSNVTEDHYLRSFIMDMDLRPSCYNCNFKQVHRVSDITLADFWSKELLKAEWNDDTGVSLVLVHSEKGMNMMEYVKEDIESVQVCFDETIKYNPSMVSSCHKPALRQRFMKDLHTLPFNVLHEKYCGNSITSKVRRKLAAVLKK